MFYLEPILAEKIQCQCPKCDCQEEFEPIETESLLNAIQHGRLNQGQIDFLKSRVGSNTCKRCFCGQHN